MEVGQTAPESGWATATWCISAFLLLLLLLLLLSLTNWSCWQTGSVNKWGWSTTSRHEEGVCELGAHARRACSPCCSKVQQSIFNPTLGLVLIVDLPFLTPFCCQMSSHILGALLTKYFLPSGRLPSCIAHSCHIYHIWDMWRKVCHVEKFQIYMHERCGEIWNFSTCKVISNLYTWQMWRHLKFLHTWNVYDVENVFKCVHVMLFCWKIGFVVIYAVFCEICFDAIYALLCGEKLN